MSQFVNQDRAKHDEDEKRRDHPGPAAGGMGQGFRKRWTKHDQNERGKKPPRPAYVNWHAGYRSDFEPLFRGHGRGSPDRKSTRLNSSHVAISYAVFCLKKKTHG